MTREEAIKWQEAFKKTYNGTPPEAEEACNMAIEALQERPKGRWENGFCSECGEMDSGEPNFCFNCGADMRESE